MCILQKYNIDKLLKRNCCKNVNWNKPSELNNCLKIKNLLLELHELDLKESNRYN